MSKPVEIFQDFRTAEAGDTVFCHQDFLQKVQDNRKMPPANAPRRCRPKAQLSGDSGCGEGGEPAAAELLEWFGEHRQVLEKHSPRSRLSRS
jgi:hypothetical protein